MNAPFSWSFTRYKSWSDCPKRYKAEHIDKTIKFEKSPAMLRGDKIHRGVEAYLTGRSPTLPQADAMAAFNPRMAEVLYMPPEFVAVEQQWAFTRRWQSTGWFSKDAMAAWLRVVLDLAILYPDWTADVVDHKTGKKYDDYGEQLELFAVGAFAFEPQLVEVNTHLWFLDIGPQADESATFKRAEMPALRAKWEARAAKMEQEEVFAPKPGNHCRFCKLARSNGGQCRFG